MVTYLLTSDVLQGFLDQINKCQKANGSTFEIPALDIPELGNFLVTFIQSIEKSLLTTFEPILKLKQLLTDYLAKPPELIKKVLAYQKEIQDIIDNPLGYIIGKIMEPISENILMPITIDLSAYVPGLIIKASKGFNTLDNKLQEQINKMINSSTELIAKVTSEIKEVMDEIAKYKTMIDNATELVQAEINKQIEELNKKLLKLQKDLIDYIKNTYYYKMLEFILLPIKTGIELFMEILALIIDALKDPVGKLTELIEKLVTKFIKTVTDMLLKIVVKIIGPLIKSINSTIENFETLMIGVIEYLTDKFTGVKRSLKYYEDKYTEFAKISRFISMIGCFFSTILVLVTQFPTLFFK